MATAPDLPPPITPDPPTAARRSIQLAESQVVPAMDGVGQCAGLRHLAMTLRFRANREFMCAATYRWPRTRSTAWVL